MVVDITDADAASTASKNKSSESSGDEVDNVECRKRKPSESSSDEEDWDNKCICTHWKGDNKMCREPGHTQLRKFAIVMNGAPKDWVDGEPRTPPQKNSGTSVASASNVIDLLNSANDRSKSQSLGPLFDGEAPAVDKAAQQQGVSSFESDYDYPRTVEAAGKYAIECYLSKYSHLKPAPSTTPTTKITSAAASSTKTTKKKAAKKAAKNPVKHSVKQSSSASAKKNNVIHLEEDEDKVTLVKAPSNKISDVWEYFRLYNRAKHPEKKNVAVCHLCYVASGETKCKEIACKDSSTSGLLRHLKSNHLKAWEKLKGVGTSKFKTPKRNQALVTSAYPRRAKDKTVDELSPEYVEVCTNFVMAEGQPLSVVEKPSFRNMFKVFHRDADQITNVSAESVKDQILHLGKLAENAVKIELHKHLVSWTTDHWTGKDNATYQTITSHYIDSDWQLCSGMIDFKVFEGSTTGKLIYEDCKGVFDEYQLSLDKVKLGVTDTTASMGKFGEYLRVNGMAHAYCTDHVLQCNAVLAFEGK